MGNDRSHAWPELSRKYCGQCGVPFDCGGRQCWCAEEAYRLPLPTDANTNTDCLCPECLRALAAART